MELDWEKYIAIADRFQHKAKWQKAESKDKTYRSDGMPKPA